MRTTERTTAEERAAWHLEIVPPAYWHYFTMLRQRDHIALLAPDIMLTEDGPYPTGFDYWCELCAEDGRFPIVLHCDVIGCNKRQAFEARPCEDCGTVDDEESMFQLVELDKRMEPFLLAHDGCPFQRRLLMDPATSDRFSA